MFRSSHQGGGRTFGKAQEQVSQTPPRQRRCLAFRLMAQNSVRRAVPMLSCDGIVGVMQKIRNIVVQITYDLPINCINRMNGISNERQAKLLL